MGLQRFPLGGFLGGMNLVDNPYSLRSGEAQLALDVDLGLRDVLSSRKGFSSAGLGSLLAFQTKAAGAGVTEEFGGEGETLPWTEVEKIKVSDNAYAKYAGLVGGANPSFFFTSIIRAKSFGFVLPTGAVPVGVKVDFECSFASTVNSSVQTTQVGLAKANVAAGTAKFPVHDYWQGVGGDSTHTFGGSEDLWGLSGALSKADVENAGFGVRISANGEGSAAGKVEPQLDFVQITVYYIVSSTGFSTEHARPWYSGANRRLMLSQNGVIRTAKEAAVTELFAGTAATVWCFEQMEKNPGTGYKDFIWAMNGTDAAKKWDGTTFGNWEGKPPKGTMLRVWKNRMIVSGVEKFPQRVFFSEIADPEKPEDETNGGYGNNWIDIRTSEDDLDPVVWLEVLDDVLLVFKKKSVNAIYDPTTFSFQRIANIGAEGRFQSCVLDDRAYFLNRTGVYSVTAQGALRYESLNLEPIFKQTNTNFLGNIDLSQLEKWGRMASLPNGRVYASVTPTGVTTNKWLLEGYPRLRSALGEGDSRTPWVLHRFKNRCLRCLATYRSKDSEADKIVAGLTDEAGANAELVFLFEGVRDGLEPITWQWRSGFKGLLTEEPFERVRRVDLLMKGQLTARMVTDGVEKEAKLLESAKEELRRFRPEARGRYHALDIAETSQVPTSVYRGELVLRGGKEH